MATRPTKTPPQWWPRSPARPTFLPVLPVLPVPRTGQARNWRRRPAQNPPLPWPCRGAVGERRRDNRENRAPTTGRRRTPNRENGPLEQGASPPRRRTHCQTAGRHGPGSTDDRTVSPRPLAPGRPRGWSARVRGAVESGGFAKASVDPGAQVKWVPAPSSKGRPSHREDRGTGRPQGPLDCGPADSGRRRLRLV